MLPTGAPASSPGRNAMLIAAGMPARTRRSSCAKLAKRVTAPCSAPLAIAAACAVLNGQFPLPA